MPKKRRYAVKKLISPRKHGAKKLLASKNRGSVRKRR